MNIKYGKLTTKKGGANRRVGVVSLGCAKNLINTEQMMYLLGEAGFDITSDMEGVDIALVNTCGFIDSAVSEAIETIIGLGEMKESGLIGKIVVSGCLPERYKNEIMIELPEVDAVAGTGSFDEIVCVIDELSGTDEKVTRFGDINSPVSETGRYISTSPAWAYLKIAEGCDNCCAYCVIPSIRGRFRSRPVENIVAEARSLVGRGIRELIVIAQDVTMYGKDIYGKRKLTDLLTELNAIEELKWIRLHYLYPDDIDDNFIDLIAEYDKIIKYLDIPIQHINDAILARMNRRSSGESIRALFRRLRERIPGVVIRTSIIAGLPGEGEEEFEELCQFLTEAKLERAGIFPYSAQEGSAAALMDRPDSGIAVERAGLLADLQSRIMDNYDKSRIGSEVTVLIEGSNGSGSFFGRSFAESPDVDGYIIVKGSGILVNEFTEVRITAASEGVLTGEKI